MLFVVREGLGRTGIISRIFSDSYRSSAGIDSSIPFGILYRLEKHTKRMNVMNWPMEVVPAQWRYYRSAAIHLLKASCNVACKSAPFNFIELVT